MAWLTSAKCILPKAFLPKLTPMGLAARPRPAWVVLPGANPTMAFMPAAMIRNTSTPVAASLRPSLLRGEGWRCRSTAATNSRTEGVASPGLFGQPSKDDRIKLGGKSGVQA